MRDNGSFCDMVTIPRSRIDKLERKAEIADALESYFKQFGKSNLRINEQITDSIMGPYIDSEKSFCTINELLKWYRGEV